jgi:hypothetical protein
LTTAERRWIIYRAEEAEMKTISDEKIGDARIRIILQGSIYRGTVIRDGKQGKIFEDNDLAKIQTVLRNEVGITHPDYFGFSGAISRFLKFFPDGFADPAYAAMERNYKLAARVKLLNALPLERAQAASREEAAQVRRAFNTNVLSQFELARMHAVLGGETGPAYVRGAATFTNGNAAAGIATMVAAIQPHGRASWPMLTYLPNLWSPERHMFLKPEKTKDYATRVNHPFAHEYDSALEPRVYRSLLDLVEVTEREVARLAPKDRIDVQSFIWVVGDYKDAQHAEIAEVRACLDS